MRTSSMSAEQTQEHFNNTWKDSIALESVNCPLCGCASSTPAHRENGFQVVRCTDCRFIYVNPRPREQP